MTTDDFMKNEVFPKFEEQITDQIFCFIESDRNLLNTYLDLLSEKDSQLLKNTNARIAKLITERYSLVNSEVENKNPNSHLIQGFHKLKR